MIPMLLALQFEERSCLQLNLIYGEVSRRPRMKIFGKCILFNLTSSQFFNK